MFTSYGRKSNEVQETVSYRVEVLDSTGRSLLPLHTVACIPQDTPERVAQSGEELAMKLATQPERVGYIVCSPFEDTQSSNS